MVADRVKDFASNLGFKIIEALIESPLQRAIVVGGDDFRNQVFANEPAKGAVGQSGLDGQEKPDVQRASVVKKAVLAVAMQVDEPLAASGEAGVLVGMVFRADDTF